MRKMNRKAVTFVLTICLAVCFAVIGMTAYAVGGNFGPNDEFTWNLNENTGTLTVGGSGILPSYGPDHPAPWDAYKAQIRQLVIEDGITTISAGTFEGLENLTTIRFPDSIRMINTTAFKGCNHIVSYTGSPKAMDLLLLIIEDNDVKELVLKAAAKEVDATTAARDVAAMETRAATTNKAKNYEDLGSTTVQGPSAITTEVEGNATTETHTYQDPITKDTITVVAKTVRNEDGTVTRTETQTASDGTLLLTSEDTLDDQGRIIARKETGVGYTQEQTTVYNEDGSGVRSRVTINEDGSRTVSTDTLDAKGNPVASHAVQYDANNKAIGYTDVINTFDENGFQTESKVEGYRYIYDDNGDMATTEDGTPQLEKTVSQTISFVPVYDEEGNQTGSVPDMSGNGAGDGQGQNQSDNQSQSGNQNQNSEQQNDTPPAEGSGNNTEAATGSETAGAVSSEENSDSGEENGDNAGTGLRGGVAGTKSSDKTDSSEENNDSGEESGDDAGTDAGSGTAGTEGSDNADNSEESNDSGEENGDDAGTAGTEGSDNADSSEENNDSGEENGDDAGTDAGSGTAGTDSAEENGDSGNGGTSESTDNAENTAENEVTGAE